MQHKSIASININTDSHSQEAQTQTSTQPPALLALGRNTGNNFRWATYRYSNNLQPLQESGEGWGASRSASALAFGDVDGDGHAELAVGRNAGDNMRFALYRYNVATGVMDEFQAGGEGWGDSRGVSALAFGDVDGDGRDELAIGRNAGDNMRWSLYRYNNATGTMDGFQTGGEGWGDSRGVSALAFGDVDGDGREELALGRNAGDNMRWSLYRYNNATGVMDGFQTGGEGWGDSRGTSALAFGDVDGDGRDELVLGRNAGDNMRWSLYRYNNATGVMDGFQTGGEGWGDSRGTSALAFGDVDDDGRDELALGRNAGGNMRWSLYRYNNATGLMDGFQTGGEGWGDSRGVSALAFGDVDGDSRAEMALGRNAGDNLRWAVYRYNSATGSMDEFQTGGEGWGDSRGVSALAIEDPLQDTDGDGLLDNWELYGFDADGDGVVDIDLPNLGANPLRKDLFVEVDCFSNDGNNDGDLNDPVDHTQCPVEGAMEDAVKAFANAPVSNEDGSTGIQLHIDTGPLYGANSIKGVDGSGGVRGTYGDLGGGNQIPEAGNEIINFTGRGTPSATNFFTLKQANFDSRRANIFRYGIFANQVNVRSPINDCTSGVAEDIGSNDFIVSLGGTRNTAGTPCWDVDDNRFSVGSRKQQAGTFMHEFGHTLNLRHGGGDNIHRKPNYLSVMNYAFQSCDVPMANAIGAPGGCDFSRIISNLNESSLDECVGIGTVYGLGQMDWNQNAILEGVSCPVPTNNNIAADINQDSLQTELAGFHDWDNILYNFRGTPSFANGVVSPVEDEATPEIIREAQERLKELFPTDVSVEITASIDTIEAGGQFDYSVIVKNNGPNVAWSTQFTVTLSSQVTLLSIDGACTVSTAKALVCDLGELEPDESQELMVSVLANAILEDSVNNSSIVTTSVTATNDPQPDADLTNNSALIEVEVVSSRVGSGLVGFYSFEEGRDSTVFDLSGVDTPINLNVNDSSATQWERGGIAVNAATSLISTGKATKITNSAIKSNEITLEGWIIPAMLDQEGPARIATLSTDASASNFMLGQGRYGNQPTALYSASLRTTDTSPDGRPATVTPNGVLSTTLTHVIYTRDSDSVARLYVNGVEESVRTVGGDFSTWDTSFPLVLAAEQNGEHPWLGEYQLLAIYSRALSRAEVEQNYQASPSGIGEITGPPVTDDLYGYSYELWTNPAAPHEQVETKIGAIIHRKGGKQVLENVPVRFYVGNPAKDGTVIGEAVVERLSPRSSAISSELVWTPSTSGPHTIYAIVDPDNIIAEVDEENNSFSRRVTVLSGILSPEDDLLAPRVDSFSINNGAEQTEEAALTLMTKATDPVPGSGVQDLLFVEYEYQHNVGEWVATQIGDWSAYTEADEEVTYPWDLRSTAGLKYLQTWARDVAGNISLFPYEGYINYTPPLESLPQDEGRIYRFTLQEGAKFTASVDALSGDPDLYIWPPDYEEGRPPWVSNLQSGTDTVGFVAPVSGIYQVEVFGYTASEYHLTTDVDESVVMAASSSFMNVNVDDEKPQRNRPLIPISKMPSRELPAAENPEQNKLFLPAIIQ